MPHAIVDDLEAPRLDEATVHHLRRVRRLRDGDPLTVTDGRGGWRWCRFADDPIPDGPVVLDDPARPALTVAFALVKGAKPELVVQKLTELGIDVIVPFVADRSVVRVDEVGRARRDERLARVAVEASMQSRRTRVPVVAPVSTFADLSARPGVARADMGGEPPTLDRPVVLIGPEGGWSDTERARVPTTVGLGPTVLRAETAAIAVAAVLVALRSGAVGPIDPVSAYGA